MTDGARAQDLAFLRSRGTDANAADAECRAPAGAFGEGQRPRDRSVLSELVTV